MRIVTLVAALSVIVTPSAMAQAPTDKVPVQPPVQQAPAPTPDPYLVTINIVRFEDLPPQLKTVVETKLRDTSADDLRVLQTSVQTSPVAMTMLAQNGLNVSQVVAATVDTAGILTLVIQDIA